MGESDPWTSLKQRGKGGDKLWFFGFQATETNLKQPNKMENFSEGEKYRIKLKATLWEPPDSPTSGGLEDHAHSFSQALFPSVSPLLFSPCRLAFSPSPKPLIANHLNSNKYPRLKLISSQFKSFRAENLIG